MSDRDLDGINLSVFRDIFGNHEWVGHHTNHAMCAICGGSSPAYGHPEPLAYSRDIAAAMLVEDRIEELGLIEEYCKQLNKIANDTWDWRDGIKDSLVWQLIHASPEDRCRAALLAAEAE